jgi:carboxylesterase type B
MGESAGAGSIMHHITSYGGNGSVPFQLAISQSPAFEPFVPAQSKAIFQQVLANVSTLANKIISTAEQLRALSYEVLYEFNQVVTGISTYGTFTFGPVVDPRPCSYVPDLPTRLISEGKSHNFSLTVGHNADEGLLFTPPYIQTQGELHEAIQMLFPTGNASIISYITDVLYPPVYNGIYGYTSASTHSFGDFRSFGRMQCEYHGFSFESRICVSVFCPSGLAWRGHSVYVLQWGYFHI